jgi:C4-dicarboxylate transporter DctQ subunit
MLQTLEQAADRLARWTGIGVMVLMAAATTLVSLSVILRYLFFTGIDWGEEATRYVMIWMGFLGTSLALRKGAHAGVEMLRAALPLPIRRIVTAIAVASMLFFFTVVVYQGFVLVTEVADKESVVIPMSMAWFYLAIPVGVLLMFVQMLPIAIRACQTGDIPQASELEGRIV